MTADTNLKIDARTFVSEINKLVNVSNAEQAKQLATKEDLSAAKLDLIKWMFGFWVTLVLLILANWFLKH